MIILMRAGSWSLLLAVGGGVCAADVAAAATAAWTATTWHDAPAWSAQLGSATAIVSPGTGRLVWFGPTGGDNLLYLPPGGSLNVGGAQLHGGHQGWLGPQARWNWPPPAGWEAGAESTTVDGATITLQLPSNEHAPRIERIYRVTPTGLACSLRWRDPQAWSAMHVLQVPRTVQIAPLTVVPSPEVPAGVIFAVELSKDVLPEACVLDGLVLTLKPSKKAAKIFLPAQPLRATIGGQELTIDAATTHGVPAGAVAHELPTQVFLSQAGQPYLELEQCSTLLLPDTDGVAAVEFTMRITPLR